MQNRAKTHSWPKHFIVPDVQNSAETHSWPKHFIVLDVQNIAKCHSEAVVQTTKVYTLSPVLHTSASLSLSRPTVPS